MTDELFPPSTVAVDSPRLRWMKELGVLTIQQPKELVGETCPETGDIIPAWVAGRYAQDDFDIYHAPLDVAGHGDTEDEALADWARRNGVRMWNETEIAS